MLTGNKGEWSEIYAFLKVIGDKQLTAGNANLEAVEHLVYPIIKILREESGGNYEYEIVGNLVVISDFEEKAKIPISVFAEKAKKLLAKIKVSSGAFSDNEIEAFLKSIYCTRLKTKSTSKSDIKIVIHDLKLNQPVELGFSIKSQLGGSATLLNAGSTTNFIYSIDNFSASATQIATINSIDTRTKLKDRLNAIKSFGGSLVFKEAENKIFENNLILIDSLLPDIISEILLAYYTTNLSSVKELTELISNQNPLKFETQYAHSFYEYKVKRFLTDIALGMTPAKVWAGEYDATGGYLVIKTTGEILCYHIYNRNQFENYLYANTRLETASSSRHRFGKVEYINRNYIMRLNLQIRFI